MSADRATVPPVSHTESPPADAPAVQTSASIPAAREVAASQASLNEIVAEVIGNAPGDRELITMALKALRQHNWAAGFTFKGARSPDDIAGPAAHRKTAVTAVRVLESKKEADALHARLWARALERAMPPETAALLRRLKADAPALVYVIAHTSLGAVKIGVSDASGSRIAEHRRRGWHLVAAFRVAADAACAIEDDEIKWWRNLGLPPFLKRDQMPQDGWTETVAMGSIDLAATVAHICEMALSPEAKPAAS
jgi:hypothetical protein